MEAPGQIGEREREDPGTAGAFNSNGFQTHVGQWHLLDHVGVHHVSCRAEAQGIVSCQFSSLTGFGCIEEVGRGWGLSPEAGSAFVPC
jgi:hypothetical protein